MVKIVVETFGEEALRKLYCDLDQKEFRWDKECELCKMPTLLHCDTSGKRLLGSCTEISGPELWRSCSKLWNSWNLFRRKMRQVYKIPVEKLEELKTSEKQAKEFELLVVDKLEEINTKEKQKAKEFELLESIMHASNERTRLEKLKAKEFKLLNSIMHSSYGSTRLK